MIWVLFNEIRDGVEGIQGEKRKRKRGEEKGRKREKVEGERGGKRLRGSVKYKLLPEGFVTLGLLKRK